MPRHRGPAWLLDRTVTHGTSMPERIDLILRLLQDQREDQAKTNAVLGDLRVEVASVQRTLDSHQAGLAEMRVNQAAMFDRLRQVETRASGMERVERDVNMLDGRVRILEQDGASARVVSGGVTHTAKEALRWALGIVAGVLLGIGGWLMAHTQ